MRTVLRAVLVIFLVQVVWGVPAVLGSEPGAAAEEGHGGGHDLIHQMMLLAFQLGVIIIAAKLGGEFFERVLRMPAVLGELASGLVIGPYALGALPLPVIGHLFPLAEAAQMLPGTVIVDNAITAGEVIIPVSPVIYGISTLASIILLFLAGLETDFKQFLRYAGPGGLVGLGGVLGAFVTGDLLTVFAGGAMLGESWGFGDPIPLFMGTISVATSVGITARVLSEKGKLDTPEGVTILAGAVIDDVLGIIVLAVVIGLARPGAAEVHWGVVAGKAFGIWLVATVAMIALARPIKRFLGWFRGDGVVPGLALGLALLLSGVMESAGLAMIIGAYVAGLALAKEEDLAHRLDRALRPMYNVLVPVFFCTMGMLVNFGAMSKALVFGLLFSVVAVFAKVIGCGLPTYLVKFNTRGALRVGFGMLPRGEVALIVAGVGLSAGIIQSDMFGVSIMMTLITTVLAPPILVKLFEGGPGVRGVEAPAKPVLEVAWATRELSGPRLDAVLTGIIGVLREREDYEVTQVDREGNTFLVSTAAGSEDFDFEIVRAEGKLEVHASAPDQDRARDLVRDSIERAGSLWDDLG